MEDKIRDFSKFNTAHTDSQLQGGLGKDFWQLLLGKKNQTGNFLAYEFS